MARRNDSRPLGRRPPSRERRPLILVVCEGEKSEPRYLTGFRDHFGNRLVRIKLIEAGGVPKTLVERSIEEREQSRIAAKEQRDANLEYDEVWCVFDIDEHPKIPDARQQARDNDVRLAISNPCFELWLLLHFDDQSAFLTRKEAYSRLKQFCHKYKKSLDFAWFVQGYDEAVRRAVGLEKRHGAIGESGANPSTTVHVLTERIRSLGRRTPRD